MACRAFYLFFATSLINSIKHEHSCKIIYVIPAGLGLAPDFAFAPLLVAGASSSSSSSIGSSFFTLDFPLPLPLLAALSGAAEVLVATGAGAPGSALMAAAI